MRGALLLAAVLVAGGPAAAQEPWKASYYPYPLKGPNGKLSLVAHWHTSQAADYYDAVPFAGILSVEAGANADGSRFGTARFRWPRMAEGWRLYAEAGVRRENRFGYFGIGNAAAGEPDDLPADSPYGWRVGRTRTWGRVELTRQIYGPARLALSGGVTDASYRALPGESVFRDDHAVDPGDIDATVRLTLIVDSRDNEVVPSRGALLEGGVLAGTGGDGYQGAYGIASAYYPPWEGTVVAVRFLARILDADAPLDARYTLDAWERIIPVLGGPESHRSFHYGRWAGRQLVLANAELRQDILNFGDYGAFTAVGFLDAGRVKEHPGGGGEPDRFRIGGGAGLALRILRTTVLQFNFAGGPDGFLFSMGTGWMF